MGGQSNTPEQPILSHEEWVRQDYVSQLKRLTGGNVTPELTELAKKLTEERLSLEEKSMKDPLTGAFNRRYVDETLDWELRAAPFLGNTMGLLFVDIDKFKSINDEEPDGHKAGDRALVELVKIMKGQVENNGFVARYGGEEFVIVFMNTDDQLLLDCAKALSVNISRKLAIDANLKRDQVTASMGMVCAIEGENVESFVSRGDKLMYEAKRSGRSRICFEGKDGQIKEAVIQ